MPDSSHAFFSNKACRYYPCHEHIEEINCLFCFCPLYTLARCPGSPRMIESGGRRIKDCSGCTFPHRVENYERVLACLQTR